MSNVHLVKKFIGLIAIIALGIQLTTGCSSDGPIPCKDLGDCLSGQACTDGFCKAEEPSASVEKGQEAPSPEQQTSDASVEATPDTNTPEPEKVQETTPEKVVETKPEQTVQLCPGGCGPGKYCDPQKRKCFDRPCSPCTTAPNACGGPPNLCLRTNTGESFCGRDCKTDKKCPAGFNCFTVNLQNGQAFQCAPASVTCKLKLGIGTACRGKDAPECPYHYPECSSLDATKEGICTAKCSSTADCPKEYKRCEDRGDGVKVCMKGCNDKNDCSPARPNCLVFDGKKTCQADPYTGPEVCGLTDGTKEGIGRACPMGANQCGSKNPLCIGHNNSTIRPFCTRNCQKDSDCGSGATCKLVSTGKGDQKVCLNADCACLAKPDLKGKKDLFAEALAKVGRDRCSLIYTKKELEITPEAIRQDPFRLKFFNPIHREPLKLLAFSKKVTALLDAALQKKGLEAVSQSLEHAALWLDNPVTTKAKSYTVASTHPLATAVAQLIKAHGGTPDTTKLQSEAAKIPADLQKKLATIVLAVSDAATTRNQALPARVTKDANYFFQRAASVVINAAQRFNLGPRGRPSGDYWLLARDFGYQKMYQASWELSTTIQQSQLSANASYKGFSFNVQTPIGRIIVQDNGDHEYDPQKAEYKGDIALLVDTGGNDTYKIAAGANTSAKNPVSVVLDLAGKDTYGYTIVKHKKDLYGRFPSDDGGRYSAPGFCNKDSDCGLIGLCFDSACQVRCFTDKDCGKPNSKCQKEKGGSFCTPKKKASAGPFSLSNRNRQGAGRLGIGFLFDLGTEKDVYHSLRMSQGFGALGVGVLYDAGGDEEYQCESGCQGSGVFGIGLHIDRSGNDEYRTFHNAQGFGFSKGAGILLDQKGDDKYLANHGSPTQDMKPGQKGDPLYASAQLPGKANSSFVQGAGFGRRADFSDGHFMSGGLGILRDVEGKDKYVSGVFAQATGYWYGTGILSDGSGDDTYDGFWYVQGSTAHYALSVFLEGSGNDKYNSTLTPVATHTGVGHDFSTSWLVDESGNDIYRAGGLTLGSGNDNGYGFLIDNGGNDKYQSRGNNSLGIAQSPNPDTNGRNTRKVHTLGFFIDAGGNDTYERPQKTILGNNKTWTQGRSKDGTPRRKLELGAGVDGEGTSTCSAK